MNEDHGHTPTPDAGRIDIDDRSVQVRINAALADHLIASVVTPYVGLERVRKALAPFHIHIPGVQFLEGEEGHHLFEVNQFGTKIGAHENGKIITNDVIKYEIRFSWCCFGGGYSCSAKLRKVGEDES
jgi:hypothetical protein